jgi:uncharacterized membrane protein
MATLASGRAPKRKSIAPDLYERLLAVGSILLLAAVLIAIGRGFERWEEMPAIVWFHLVTIVAALGLTPWLLLQKRGTRLHRRLGWTWAAAMMATAVASLFVRGMNYGGWSPIHILSVVTIVGVPAAVWRARLHDVSGHRQSMRILITGALILAGVFTFPFDRTLGRWLFG